MAKFRSKPFEIEATQWWKNGDHPKDNTRLISTRDDGAFLSEGEVVRRFNHPEVSGSSKCPHCHDQMARHGWIDTRGGGHKVCPGDWIITEPEGPQRGYYPCRPDVFAMKYEPAEDEAREF